MPLSSTEKILAETLWRKGRTGSQIAMEIGYGRAKPVTRNMIVGLAHRGGWSKEVVKSSNPALSHSSVKWSDAEIETLRCDYAVRPVQEIADELGRSFESIKSKASDLKLKRPRNPGVLRTASAEKGNHSRKRPARARQEVKVMQTAELGSPTDEIAQRPRRSVFPLPEVPTYAAPDVEGETSSPMEDFESAARVDDFGPRTIFYLRACHCRWPLDENPRDPLFRYCGERVCDGGPWCERHKSMAYQPIQEVRRRRAEEKRALRWG